MFGECATTVPESARQCDALGTCSLGDCNHLDPNLLELDRQLALYVLESMSGIHHSYKMSHEALQDVGAYLATKSEWMTDHFTFKIDYQEQKNKKMNKDLIFAVDSGTFLMTTSLLKFAENRQKLAVNPATIKIFFGGGLKRRNLDALEKRGVALDALQVMQSAWLTASGIAKALEKNR